MANIFRIISTKFYQNRPGFVDDVTKKFGMVLNRLGFVEDMTKTFWCFFSVHSVLTDC